MIERLVKILILDDGGGKNANSSEWFKRSKLL